ncbi:phospholipase D-like domain-containing protein [Stanieria cyanosphaera]|uniref:phospholipase D-like domain-containing protein n=1 Tax=Stanieria cyanosphaera TaxID=102116 RepID=UPI001FE0BB58|nr:phospholipase D-like domain-containing protein [Stanieria cyanosphaera]
MKQDQFIQVYFNYQADLGNSYTDPYRKITRPGDDLEAVILKEINAAQSSIDLAVQEFKLPKIAKALVQKYRSGVKVRVILENNYSLPLSQLSLTEVNRLASRDRSKYQDFLALIDSNQDGRLSNSEIAQGDALIIFKNAGIPLIDDTADGSKGSGLMHHKFMIIDRKIVLTGSVNYTLSDIHGDFTNLETRGNANNLLVINNQQLARLFTEEFNYMWGDGVGGNFDSLFGLAKPYRSPQQLVWNDTTVEIQFSPTSPSKDWELSSNGLIGKTISNADNSIDLALFVFSEQKLVDLLAQAQQKQVKIQGIFEPEFALRSYSEVLDMWGVALRDRCKYEANNNPWKKSINTVGIAQLVKGDKLHHKFAVIDRNTVITGSHNWSEAANYNNDENLLIIKNATVAQHFQQQFNLLYEQTKLEIPPYFQTKLAKQQQQCF